jgi:hypothetical protein
MAWAGLHAPIGAEGAGFHGGRRAIAHSFAEWAISPWARFRPGIGMGVFRSGMVAAFHGRGPGCGGWIGSRPWGPSFGLSRPAHSRPSRAGSMWASPRCRALCGGEGGARKSDPLRRDLRHRA